MKQKYLNLGVKCPSFCYSSDKNYFSFFTFGVSKLVQRPPIPSSIHCCLFCCSHLHSSWKGLKFTCLSSSPDPTPPRFPSGLNRKGWARACGLRTETPGSRADAEILIASLGFSLDPITLSSLDTRPVSPGSGYSARTNSQSFEHDSLTLTDGDADIQYKCAPTYSHTLLWHCTPLSSQACWCSWLQSNSGALFWCTAPLSCIFCSQD